MPGKQGRGAASKGPSDGLIRQTLPSPHPVRPVSSDHRHAVDFAAGGCGLDLLRPPLGNDYPKAGRGRIRRDCAGDRASAQISPAGKRTMGVRRRRLELPNAHDVPKGQHPAQCAAPGRKRNSRPAIVQRPGGKGTPTVSHGHRLPRPGRLHQGTTDRRRARCAGTARAAVQLDHLHFRHVDGWNLDGVVRGGHSLHAQPGSPNSTAGGGGGQFRQGTRGP